jgi:hypothetical protein
MRRSFEKCPWGVLAFALLNAVRTCSKPIPYLFRAVGFKIGLASPPIETATGWLVLYHGVRQTPSSALYRLGLALFDLEKPTNACCEAIPGSSGQKPTTNVAVMSMTWFSRADIRWA